MKMRLSRIRIENFRNFQCLDVELGHSVVIIGENQIGKTNLLYALRLLLDPSLPDSARQLRMEDFWDGLPRPLSLDSRIRVLVEISDFEESEGQLALLAESLVQAEPMVARLTYEFGPVAGLNRQPNKADDFQFTIYGGKRQDARTGFDLRRRMPLEVMQALRDAEGDLARWNRSPLRPLIDRVSTDIDPLDLGVIAGNISSASSQLATHDAIVGLGARINDKLIGMIGAEQTIDLSLGLAIENPEKLLRGLRLLFDGNNRDVSETSLGIANLLYLALRSLDLDSLVSDGSREHTLVAIEEPEAHLHPHLQRLAYSSYLRGKQPSPDVNEKASPSITYLLTTHSPHIVSVAPSDSLVFLRKGTLGGTTGISGASIPLSRAERDDIERYLDVNRAEGLFSRGILMVEGEAERFLVPTLARMAGIDLDKRGISVCCIGGTNFETYVKFFGPLGMNLRVAVLTDLDPVVRENAAPRLSGVTRAHSLCPLLDPQAVLPSTQQDPGHYGKFGIFLNASTLELELAQSGFMDAMSQTMKVLCNVGAAVTRFERLAQLAEQNASDFSVPNPRRFLSDIEYVGKGRFAQGLSALLARAKPSGLKCPAYVEHALRYVVQGSN